MNQDIDAGTLVRWVYVGISQIPYGTLGIVRSLSGVSSVRVEWLDVDGLEYSESKSWYTTYMEIVE